MFRLDTEFYRLPLRLDAARLAEEVLQFSESEWREHPQKHAGNSALPLVSVGGGINDDVKGPMQATPFLARCPYIRQVLASLGTVIGRARLMRIAGQSDATAHVDTNYYWMHHVRVHIPAVTYPEVRFMCNEHTVNMAAGETWIFDSWKTHNVINPVDSPRIHLVADTVGSAHFWELVERSHRPFDANVEETEPAGEVVFEPGAKPAIEFEKENFPLVMSPFEQQALASRIINDLLPDVRQSQAARKIIRTLDRLHKQWHALWTAHRDSREGWDAFRRTIAEFDALLPDLAGELALFNRVPLVEALRQAIIRPALNPEVEKYRVEPCITDVQRPETVTVHPRPGSSVPPPASDPLFDRPVFIVAAPRSGSSMLFELLKRSPDVWTIGGESHYLIEGIPGFDPAKRGFDSNRLTAADADDDSLREMRTAFFAQLRSHDGHLVSGRSGALRMLEKTPKNALRIPLLAAAFPGAHFIFLYREPRGNVSSILDAWRSQRFVTYPELPGWNRDEKWSLLLTPGWRELAEKPLAEIAARQWTIANETILDDLEKVPRQRWCAIAYDEICRDPQSAAERLCAFAGWRWTEKISGALPLSAHTLTPPDSEKWKRNETELASVLSLTDSIAQRAETALGSHPPFSTPAPALVSSAPIPVMTAPLDFNSEHTTSLPEVLETIGATIAVSTYQAGKLIFVRSKDGVLNTHFRDFQSPMGLAFGDGFLAVGARHEVWKFRAFREPAAMLPPQGAHDAVFLPGARYTTGDIRIHETAFVGEELWAVNTRFSCLCTFDGRHNFVPRWRPPFVTALAPEDRCHLNGFALIGDSPAYVTALAETDTAEGWRAHKTDGGCLLDINTGETIVNGLCMPHSPRFYDGKLWILESGCGRLSTVDLDTGKLEPVAELPGFTRGLDFCGPFAFVGLSQVRETAVFNGLPICEKNRERECGMWVVDIHSGKIVAFLRFSGSVQEIFAVQVLQGIRYPELIQADHELIAGTFFVPPEAVAKSAEPALAGV